MLNSSEIDPNLILNLTLDEFLDSIGNILIIDIIYMYFNTTITFLGTFFSIICIWVFFHKDFNLSLYTYYKILSITSLVHEFFGFWYSLCYSPRFVPLKYQYDCVDYGNTFVAIHYFCFFHSGLIEISILIDRISIFEPRVKKYFKIKPKIMLTIFLSVAITIGVMGLFIYKGTDLIWYNYEYENSSLILKKHKIYFFDTTDFGKTSIGKIYVAIESFMLNVPLLILTLILNITLIIVMKKHLTSIAARFTNQSQYRKKLKSNRKTSIMAITLCFVSIISRTVTLTAIIVFNFGSNSTSLTLISLADLFMFVNSGCLFFVCFSFNKIFKNHLKRILRIRHIQENIKTSEIGSTN